MNNEEIKTTAEALDQALIGETTTVEATDDMDVEIYTPDDQTNEEPTTEEEPEMLQIVLAVGITLNISMDEMDWDGIWTNSSADMFNNVAVSKLMMKDMLSEADPAKRNELAEKAIENISTFFKSVGVPPEINYDVREDISLVEKACLYLTDGIILMTELMHTAEVYVLTSKTYGMSLDDMIQKMSDSMANFKFGDDAEENA